MYIFKCLHFKILKSLNTRNRDETLNANILKYTDA